MLFNVILSVLCNVQGPIWVYHTSLKFISNLLICHFLLAPLVWEFYQAVLTQAEVALIWCQKSYPAGWLNSGQFWSARETYKDKQIWRQCRGRVPVQEFSISCMFSHLEISFFFMLLTDFKFPFIHFIPFLNWDEKRSCQSQTKQSLAERKDQTSPPRGSLGFLQPPVHLFWLWEETGVELDLTRPAVRHLR